MWFHIVGLLVMLALGILAAPLTVEAQQPAKVYRVGFLSLLPQEQALSHIKALHEGLRGAAERLPGLVAELIHLKVDIIVTGFGTLPALAAKQATSTIPIVFSFVADPVGSGIVASLARPGGNITGLSTLAADLAGKRVELLKEILPQLSRIAILLNPATPAATQALRETQAITATWGVQLQPLEVRTPEDFESSFAVASQEHADALITVTDPFTIVHRARIVELAAKSRLPAIYGMRDFVEAGGLISYGANYNEPSRRAAAYVDKILKGAKPADLPVEQPMKFELVVNLKTAQLLGLTIPPTLLFQADEVIR